MNYSDKPDDELIKDILNGVSAAFEVLMKRYQNKIYTLIYRMTGNKGCADELFQETFIKIYRNVGKLKEPVKFYAWALHIASNTCYDYLRKKKHEKAILVENIPAMSCAGWQNPEQETATNQEIRKLISAIHELPATQQEVVILRIHSGLTFKEIAGIMNKPLNSVLTIMHQAILSLRKCIKE